MFKAFDATKRAAYLLWEHTGFEDALSHVYRASNGIGSPRPSAI